eukprot:Phypoly_transcript_09953.p1 GENE.Phypoly_transcript_09953~~Phypoly_transcript_09953.p1  ORF type:complete len:208 (+),score=33.77 Phypoly_transcript_09953:647-1270(+)
MENESGLKEGLNMALEAQGTNSKKKWGYIMKDYNDLVGSPTAAIGSSTDANAIQESKLLFSKREPCAYFNNCTLCLIKPHAVKEGLTGEIVNAILEQGFRITAMEMMYMTEAQASDFFVVYKGVLPEYNDFVAEMSTGPCVAMEIREEGGKVTQNFREFCGPHDPDLARTLRPNTLRALFGTSKVKNAVHCTDLPEDALEEVFYFFQ